MTEKKIKLASSIKYLLLITQKHDEQEKKIIALFTLRTVMEFSNFSYEIRVDQELIDRKIKFMINGISIPRLKIPSPGPAIYKKAYDMLEGLYEIVISTRNNKENRFLIDLKRDKVVIKNSPQKKFIDVVID